MSQPSTRRRGALAALAALGLLVHAHPVRGATLFDPQIEWRTLETPHFRVNYPARREAVAQRTAAFAEEAYDEVVPFLDHAPPARTEVTLIDNEDTSNGFAISYPSAMIYLYLASSDQDDLQGRYESYLKRLITHEFTHVAQFETTGGLTAFLNRVFGRALFPNLFQPFFLIEGLAVAAESRDTAGGRLREGDFDMILRTSALEDKLLSIDRASVFSYADWPFATSYIYGSYFYQYVMERYGADFPAKLAKQYGSEPWFGINHAVSKVLPGKNAYILWDELASHLKARAKTQLERIARLPITQGERVTTDGYFHRHPRWTPDGKLLYGAFSKQQSSSLMLDERDGKPPRRLFGKHYSGAYAVSGKRFLYLTYSHETGPLSSTNDLYRYDREAGTFTLVTDGKHASDPAVSPDGKFLVATLSEGGTSNLALFDTGGALQRMLTDHQDGTQYSGNTWSPDGKTVASSVWHSGSRDLYLFEPGRTDPAPLWRDSAIDLNPQFSSDGRLLYFASDRSGGVFNLFAYDLRERRLFQLTNVVGGAIEPAPSPDGKLLAYSDFSAAGWDIRLMPLDPTTWREVPLERVTANEPFSGAEIPAPPVPAAERMPKRQEPFPSSPYHAWPSFSPKLWAPVSYMDENSYMAGLTTVASDVLLQHYAFVNAGWGLGGNRPYYVLSYQNDQLLPTLGIALSDLPTTYGLRGVDLWQRQVGGSAWVTYPGLPSKWLGAFSNTGHSYTLGYNWLSIGDLGYRARGTHAPLVPLTPELVAAKGKPRAGQINSLTLRYQFADNHKPTFAISPESGSAFGLDYEKAGAWFGGTTGFDRVSADYRRYLSLPWKHHVLALRAAGGVNFGRTDGDYYLGGNDSTNLFSITDQRYIGGVSSSPLRGYRTASLTGSRMLAGSAEYRFPIADVMHGPGTIPLFLTRVSGAVFADVGAVGGERLDGDMHLGLGSEVRVGIGLPNYPTELRLGAARGTHPRDGGNQFYAELGISF